MKKNEIMNNQDNRFQFKIVHLLSIGLAIALILLLIIYFLRGR